MRRVVCGKEEVMKTLRASVLSILSFLFVIPTPSFSVGPRFVARQTNTTWTATRTRLNINNISTEFRNDGWTDRNSLSGNPGCLFPVGTAKSLVFQSGLVWGAKIYDPPGDTLRVGGATYSVALQPGRILSPGVPEDPNLPKNRIYRVRPDYLTADLSVEATEEERTQTDIRAQYALDWSQWPAVDGAPFHDRNNNGMYEPAIDIPGKVGADQTIWYVCNDLDTARTRALYGSIPLGLEMQVTVWGYNRSGSLNSAILKQYRLINKSTRTFDSMFVCQWVDPDLGDAGDDFAGCDTTLHFGYCYNGGPIDNSYAPFPPPAVGYQLLNLPMTASFTFVSGSPISDPPFSHDGARQWYNLLQGLIPISGVPFVHPNVPGPTRFWYDGDPVAGTGRIDGAVSGPGDRRFGTCAGPFVMLPGESKDIVIGHTAAMGSNNLSSVIRLKEYTRNIRTMVNGLLASAPPKFDAHVTVLSPIEASVQLVADGRPARAQSITARIMRQDGSQITSVGLFDDGLHGDGGANDGIWGNSVTINRQQTGLYVNATTVDSSLRTFQWERIDDNITTLGQLQIRSVRIFSDNINSDGIVNPRENIRFGISTYNPSTFGVGGLTLFSLLNGEFSVVSRPGIPAGGVDSMVYDENNSLSYFSFTAPDSGVVTIPIIISDTSSNQWRDEVAFTVQPLAHPIQHSVISHVAGSATGDLSISVLDPTLVQNHLYAIYGVNNIDSLSNPGFTLRDITTNTTLLLNHPLPDPLGHNVPVTAGFKILLGTLETRGGMRNWEIPPPGDRRWTWVDGSGLQLEGFEGAIGWEDPAHYFGLSDTNGVRGSRLRNVLIRLATASSGTSGNGYNPYAGWNRETTSDPNMSYAYRYLRLSASPPARPEFAPYIINTGSGYLYQDYRKGMPFSAWDVESNPTRRLAVGFLENNISGGLVDGCWWPPGSGFGQDNTTVREWFFVFDRPYTDATPIPELQQNIFLNSLPVMWMGTVTRRFGWNFSQPPLSSGDDQFLILAKRTVSSEDEWNFNPTILVSTPNGNEPLAFELFQNYPNPFNPSTTIRYQLPIQSKVTIRLYNILGQNVRTLVDGIQEAGFKSAQWNGMSDAARLVASGVYFCRIEAHGVSDASKSFTQVRKMLLLR
jgi:hypothetical protein